MANCFNHPERSAIVHCVVCGKGVCKECVTMKKFCSSSCAAAGAVIKAHEDRSKEWKKRSSSGWIRPLAILLILILMGYCAYHYYQRNKATVKNKVQQVSTQGQKTLKEVKKKSKETIKEGQDYLNRDSRYKKERQKAAE